MNNKTLMLGAGTIIAIGLFAYLYSTFTVSPLEPAPAAATEEVVQQEIRLVETVTPATTAPVQIASTADAVTALEGFDGDALDAELDSTLADIDASFE